MLATGPLLAGALVAIGVVAGPAPSALAAGALDCSNTLYQISPSDRTVASVPFSAVGSASTVTSTAVFSLAAGVTEPNALGIDADGSRAYYLGKVNGVDTVIDYNARTGASSYVAIPRLDDRVAGAVDPVSGRYYFGSTTAGQRLFAYDPSTGSVFPAGTVPAASDSGTANGDYAFSSSGDLFIVGNARLVSVAAENVPSRGTTTQLPGTLLSSGAFTVSNGVAFDNNGSLYVENVNGTTLQKVNPVTGGVEGTNTTSTRAGVDLASCATPSTLTLQKDLSSRAADADQFSLSIRTPGAPTIEATTSGSATGVQAAKAGPTIGLAGRTYSLAETGAGSTNLLDYSSSYKCVDRSRDDQIISRGGATSFDLTYPSGYGRNVVCTFSNAAQPQSYTVEKSASTQKAAPGSTVTYTVTVKNTGDRAYRSGSPASFTDDLSAVLDDATYNGDASSGASVTGTTLAWSGELEVGQTTTVTYSVTVKTPDTGDNLLKNTVTPTGNGGTCVAPGRCETTTPVQSFTVEKSVSEKSTTPGGKLTYTLTVKNTGQVAYTTTDPAAFTDDLTRVLDDAVYDDDATATGGTLSYAAPKLDWSGAVGIGETVTITYSVTVNDPDAGDHTLVNTVVPRGTGAGCASPGGCTTTTPVQSIVFQKTADTASALPGDTVTYTITAKNTGQLAYTVDEPATFTDDLTQVLDDARYNDDAKATAGDLSYQQPTLSWSGPVGIGETVTITYTVRVNTPDTGDKVLDNTVVSTVPGSSCPAGSEDPGCRVVVPTGSYSVSKTASTDAAAQGSRITYTVTVTNTGETAYTDARPASFRDDLTRVLDDATYSGDARATGGSVAYDRPTLGWSGPLAIGDTVTVTYSVTVNTPDSGDRTLVNVVVPTGPGGECATDMCTTTTRVPPGVAVPTGGTALALTGTPAGWVALGGVGIAALVAGVAIWIRRRRTDLTR